MFGPESEAGTAALITGVLVAVVLLGLLVTGLVGERRARRGIGRVPSVENGATPPDVLNGADSLGTGCLDDRITASAPDQPGPLGGPPRAHK